MKTAPFDLEKALAGHPLVTRDGALATNFLRIHPAGLYPFGAVVNAQIRFYTETGRYDYRERRHNKLDLFLAIEDTPTQPSPLFQVGDLVRHRASLTRGVVVRVDVYQTEPPRYGVSTEFDATSSMLPEIVLEPWIPPSYGTTAADSSTHIAPYLK